MRQRGDRLDAQMMRGEERAHRDGLVDARECPVEEIAVELADVVLLGLDADLAHRLDRFNRIAPGGGLGRQHDRIRTVEHGVGDVGHFRAGRHRIYDHRFHHLGRGDRKLVALAGQAEHALLESRHSRSSDLDRQVSAGNHDAIGGLDDLFQRRNRLRALDLGDEQRLAACGAQQLARHVHVFLVLGKRHRDIVGLDRNARLHVVHVLGGQRGCGQSASLVVRKHAADFDSCRDFVSEHGFHLQLDQAVVKQQHITRGYIARQLLVVETDPLFVPELAVRVENEVLAGLERYLAVRELADAYLRALQIGHDGDLATERPRGVPHKARALLVIGGGAVREVETHDVDARCEHAIEHVLRAAGRAQRRDDLGGALHSIS